MPQSSPTDDNSFPSPGLKCTTTTESPFFEDCLDAYQKITPGDPEVCIMIISEQWDYITVGTSTVHTYSQAGNAHCLNGDYIRKGVLDILSKCTKDGQAQGSSTWTKEGNPREGVKLIRSASQEWVLREGCHDRVYIGLTRQFTPFLRVLILTLE